MQRKDLKTRNISRPTVSQIEEELKRRSHIGKIKRAMRNIVISLIIVASVTVLIAMLWLPVMQVHGTSMEPVLNDGEILVAVRGQRYIRRGDIVAFYYNNQVLVRRVVCLGGKHISIEEDGTVYINSQALEEPYLENKSVGQCNTAFPYFIPSGYAFVMGDNREIAMDSRLEEIGPVPMGRIIGKVILTI